MTEPERKLVSREPTSEMLLAANVGEAGSQIWRRMFDVAPSAPADQASREPVSLAPESVSGTHEDPTHKRPMTMREIMESDECDPPACSHCGAVAGACDSYPNCPGGTDPTQSRVGDVNGIPPAILANALQDQIHKPSARRRIAIATREGAAHPDNADAPTPETDENESDDVWDGGVVPVDFARRMERERDEAREDANRNAGKAAEFDRGNALRIEALAALNPCHELGVEQDVEIARLRAEVEKR